jgi:hypothetical protein
MNIKDDEFYNRFYHKLHLFESIRDYFYPINKRIYELIVGIINSFYPKEENVKQIIGNNENLLVIIFY